MIVVNAVVTSKPEDIAALQSAIHTMEAASREESELEGAIVEAKAVLENQEADVEALKAPKDKMMEIMQSFAEDLYKAQAAEEGDSTVLMYHNESSRLQV